MAGDENPHLLGRNPKSQVIQRFQATTSTLALSGLDILTPHGWAFAGEYGEQTRWCRPGKDGGVSATTNHQGSDLLHVFSSNADPFEAEGSYSKFAAYALIHHAGDFKEAARDLREQGYGKKMLKAGKR